MTKILSGYTCKGKISDGENGRTDKTGIERGAFFQFGGMSFFFFTGRRKSLPAERADGKKYTGEGRESGGTA